MSDVETLARRFAACTLPKAEWTHEAHLRVGLWHVAHDGAGEALGRLRDGIRRLNDAHGTPNTASSGYHETITRAYVTLLAAFLARCPEGLPLDDKAELMLAGALGDRQVLFRAYSPDRLLSPDARAAWVEPDIAPLDAIDPIATRPAADGSRPSARGGSQPMPGDVTPSFPRRFRLPWRGAGSSPDG